MSGIEHVIGAEPPGLQLVEIEVDHHLALLAAVGVRDGRSGNGDELGAQKVDGDVVQLGLAQALAGEAELQNGNGGGVVVEDQRRQGAWGHVGASAVCAMAVICALARSMLACGCR